MSGRITAEEAKNKHRPTVDETEKDLKYIYGWIHYYAESATSVCLSADRVKNLKVKQQLTEDGYTLSFDVNGFGERVVVVSWADTNKGGVS